FSLQAFLQHLGVRSEPELQGLVRIVNVTQKNRMNSHRSSAHSMPSQPSHLLWKLAMRFLIVLRGFIGVRPGLVNFVALEQLRFASALVAAVPSLPLAARLRFFRHLIAVHVRNLSGCWYFRPRANHRQVPVALEVRAGRCPDPVTA